MKNLKYGVAILAITAFLGIALIANFVVSSLDYDKQQDTYFSKSSYFMKGQVHSYEYLGGVTSLLYIKLDSISITKRLGSNEKFTGLYYPTTKTAIMVATFDYPEIREMEVSMADLPYIVVDSDKRSIRYSGQKFNMEETLRPADVYEEYLTAIEMKEGGVRF